VQADVVLADIAGQVAAGAQHITFGDPDFFNGYVHAARIVEELHRRWPDLTYDVTIKIEHLLKHPDGIPLLRSTGCAVVTTAVESLDDVFLAIIEKGHTREDFREVVGLFRQAGLSLNPTFIPFHPWMTIDSYCDFLAELDDLDIIESVAPVQWSIRLLVPAGSRLLELDDTWRHLKDFDPESLVYPWSHPDPRVDELYEAVREAISAAVGSDETQVDREQLFATIVGLAHGAAGYAKTGLPGRLRRGITPRPPPPYLQEPWYC
jgi:hypothetical protein